ISTQSRTARGTRGPLWWTNTLKFRMRTRSLEGSGCLLLLFLLPLLFRCCMLRLLPGFLPLVVIRSAPTVPADRGTVSPVPKRGPRSPWPVVWSLHLSLLPPYLPRGCLLRAGRLLSRGPGRSLTLRGGRG